MKPLKLAILWHQHQPFYKLDGEYKLPWVRLHGIKDYLDMALILYDYPAIKQTFNLVPSLLMQLQEYADGKADETILTLTKKPANLLTDSEKRKILESFFICNEINMIKPYIRYKELFDKSKTGDINSFTIADWLDLQIWYNLTWFGPITRNRNELKYLFSKARNFSESDKNLMLSVQTDVLSEIIPTLKRLFELGQIALSISPFYHPILPLLCNTNSTLESAAGSILPEKPFCYPQDAIYHVSEAAKYFQSTFGTKPIGMWPSEGSVSDEVINIIAENGFSWLATDEQIMMNSSKEPINRLERFFPRLYSKNDKNITLFFREHFLSDLIGFQYSSWEPKAAALDFVNRLKYVRWELITEYGEESLDKAVVPIIMDGENCWEFYSDNGKPFLDELYYILSNEEEIKTVTFSEAIKDKVKSVKPFNHIKAGSWIDGNFNIWIGQSEHQKAWNALRATRDFIEKQRMDHTTELITKAMEIIYIAEGSDWFWWYSDAHQAPNKYDFDIMFRKHLQNIYSLFSLPYPEYLDSPFAYPKQDQISRQALSKISPTFDSIIENEWDNSGFYLTARAMDAMHSGASILSKVNFGNDSEQLYLRFDLKKPIESDESIFVQLNNEISKSINITKDKVLTDIENLASKNFGNRILISIPLHESKGYINLKLTVSARTGISNFPREGTFKIKLIS